MNAMVIEEDGRRVLVDFGVLFPNDQVLGVEVAVPDMRYLREAGGLAWPSAARWSSTGPSTRSTRAATPR